MQKRPIRVALFSEVLKEHLDGVTNTLYHIIDRIPKDTFEFLFITSYPPSEHVRLPFPVITVPKIAFPTNPDYPISLPFFNRKVKQALDWFKPDLIHLTTPFTLGNWALSYGKEKKVPVVTTYHTHFISYIEYYFKYFPMFSWMLDKGGRRYMKWFYNQCDHIFVPTSSIVEELEACGIEKNRMTIWGRGIDTSRYNPANRDEAYMDTLAGSGTKRILFVSRLVWEKELKTLAGIALHFRQTRPEVRFIITGDGPRRKELERMMPDAIFTGKLLKSELAKVYASSDVFVFPSITETFGNVVLEAMASGTPPVVAAQGGPKGIVHNGITGLHAKPKSVADFCSKIAYLLDYPEIAKEMGANAAAYAESQRWDMLVAEMFATYRSVLGLPSESKEREIDDKVAV